MRQQLLKDFYVLEGIDGSGTTTQLEIMAQQALQSGLNLHTTFEPTSSPIGSSIREILSGSYKASARAIARLFAADRCDHLENKSNGILAMLNTGRKVLCDRYLFSSLVYQSLELPIEEVAAFNPFPLPEILFYIDTPPEIGIMRRQERPVQEIYETESLQARIYRNYETVLDYHADSEMQIIRIDGTKEIEEISEIIWSNIC